MWGNSVTISLVQRFRLQVFFFWWRADSNVRREKQLKALVTTSSCYACSHLACRPASSADPSAVSSSLSRYANTRLSLSWQEHRMRRWPCRRWCSGLSRWIGCSTRCSAQSFDPRCMATRRSRAAKEAAIYPRRILQARKRFTPLRIFFSVFNSKFNKYLIPYNGMIK